MLLHLDHSLTQPRREGDARSPLLGPSSRSSRSSRSSSSSGSRQAHLLPRICPLAAVWRWARSLCLFGHGLPKLDHGSHTVVLIPPYSSNQGGWLSWRAKGLAREDRNGHDKRQTRAGLAQPPPADLDGQSGKRFPRMWSPGRGAAKRSLLSLLQVGRCTSPYLISDFN